MAEWRLTYRNPRYTVGKVVYDRKTEIIDADTYPAARVKADKILGSGGVILEGCHHKKVLIRLAADTLSPEVRVA